MSSTCSSCSRRYPQSNRCCRGWKERQRRVSHWHGGMIHGTLIVPVEFIH